MYVYHLTVYKKCPWHFIHSCVCKLTAQSAWSHQQWLRPSETRSRRPKESTKKDFRFYCRHTPRHSSLQSYLSESICIFSFLINLGFVPPNYLNCDIVILQLFVGIIFIQYFINTVEETQFFPLSAARLYHRNEGYSCLGQPPHIDPTGTAYSGRRGD